MHLSNVQSKNLITGWQRKPEHAKDSIYNLKILASTIFPYYYSANMQEIDQNRQLRHLYCSIRFLFQINVVVQSILQRCKNVSRFPQKY